MTNMYATRTGRGMALITLINFGDSAVAIRIAPPKTPTRRAATPVRIIRAELEEPILVGSVPANAASRLTNTRMLWAPWTTRKSGARGRRQATCWMATVSLMELTVVARFTKMNPGSRAQKVVPKLRSKPGQTTVGMPIQGALATSWKSYRPNRAATTQPARIPITGAHCCQAGEAKSFRPTKTTSVTAAMVGAVAGGEPAELSDTLASTTEMTVAASSIRTVPDTAGVIIRRNFDSWEIRPN